MRVLVVDDDPAILTLLQLNLELEGHEVVAAANGAEAIDAARRLDLDVVLLDVMMPELDGFAVCQELRADPLTEHLRIVFVSAKAQAADMQRGDAVGADAYITKPFDPMELVRLLERVTAGGRGARDDVEPGR